MKSEYHLIKKKDDFCNTAEQFKSLLLTNEQISIKGDTISLSQKSLNYSLRVIEVITKSKSETVFYFVLTTSSNDEKAAALLEKFDTLLHRICDKYFTIMNTTWDGASIYYAKKLYPLFIEVENLLRKIIYRFMIKVAGSNWFDSAVPVDVKKAVVEIQEKAKPDQKDANQLFYANFNQLGKFLFDKYTLTPYTQEFVQKLKKLIPEDDKSIDKEKVKMLLESYEAKSNWERYFSDKIQVDGLNEKWDELYSYRNQVAHTRRIKKNDYMAAKKILDELLPAFNSCLESIDNVNLTEEQSEAAQEFAKETVSRNGLNNLPGLISGLETFADIVSKFSLDNPTGLNPALERFLYDDPILNKYNTIFETTSKLNSSLEGIVSMGVNEDLISNNTIKLSGSTSDQLAELTKPLNVDIPTIAENTILPGI